VPVIVGASIGNLMSDDAIIKQNITWACRVGFPAPDDLAFVVDFRTSVQTSVPALGNSKSAVPVV